MNIDHGPAVQSRVTDHKNPDFNYPERFAGRVPETVKVLRRVTPDWPMYMGRPHVVAKRDAIYPAWTNSHGAVSAILPCGERLGLLPREYEVVTWLDPVTP